jgi:DNA-binding transcriptional ArsR family regulator
MSKKKDHKGLQFACECVSARGGYSDPWAGVAQRKLLPDGTKEAILNLVGKQPKTIAQIAKELGISRPAVHRHINEMVESELLRESEEWERKYPAERYYEPNFPIIKAAEGAEFESLCQELSRHIADLFDDRRGQLESAFKRTSLPEEGWTFSDVAQYLYARAQRGARVILEQRGTLLPRKEHRNGVEWIFWAEEPHSYEQ